MQNFMDRSASPRIGGGLTPADISSALIAQELYLHYQAQVDAVTGKLRGFEALMRWNSPTLGAVAPGEFIPLVESSEVIHEIWDYLLQHVSEDRVAHGIPADLHVALNLSANQLIRPGLSGAFENWLKAAHIDCSQVHVEITESALLQMGQSLERNLWHMRDLGVSIWLDDFGTGFSSLRHLRDLPITGLKIDQSFVCDLEDNLDDFRIVSAIVAMANSLGLAVIAEGVESISQARMLTQLGCDMLQGYLIGRPVAMAEALQAWSAPRPPGRRG